MSRISAAALTACIVALAPSATCAAPSAGQVQARPDDDNVTFRMAAGQSLYGLARTYFVRQGDYRVVQTINHIADPLHIPVGTMLAIPVRLLRAEPLTARVVAVRGAVSLANGGATVPARADATVAPGAMLETGPDGFVSLALSNGSQVSIPTRSRVRIVKMQRILLTDSVDFDIRVEAGKIETRATPLPAGRGSFRLHTPRAVSAIRGTTLRVGFEDAAGASATEVVEGKVQVGAQDGADGDAQLVPQGFGAQVSATGKLALEPLLPAPELIDPGKVLIDPVAAFAVKPVPGAVAYHAQVASDAGFTDIVTEASAPGAAIAMPALADGRWFVRLTAISARGLEGLPQVYSVRRALTGLSASAAAGPDGIRFTWQGTGSGTRTYRFQLVRDDPRNPPTIDEPGLTQNSLKVSSLSDGTYLWRVGMRQYDGGEMTETWLPFQTFIMAGAGR